MAEEEKKVYSKQLIDKVVVTKSGKRLGVVSNLTFETRTGELMQIILKNPTPYVDQMELEQDKKGSWMIPYSAVVAIGDFVVISEEDIV